MTEPPQSVISRRFTPWQKAAALVPALLLLVCLPAQVMLRCRVDGLLRTECCCSHQGEEQASGPAMTDQECCDREVTQGQQPKADVARSASRDLVPIAALAVFPVAAPLLAPAPSRFDSAIQRYRPAREGPPLVLLKHAFLI
jgi:hypothetical protein